MTAGIRARASTSSPRTMASRCATWSATTRNTTKRTAKKTATARNDNDSWNCGAEGPTDDPAINALRARQQRNFLATLLLSQGVPMLLAGDEFGQTQGGNNNAYCQDSPVAWLDWNWTEEQRDLFDFARSLIRLRQTQPVFQRRHFFQGRTIHGPEIKDLYWLKADGDGDVGRRLERRPCAHFGHGVAGRPDRANGRAGPAHQRRYFRASAQCRREPVPFQSGSAAARSALAMRLRHRRFRCSVASRVSNTRTPSRFKPGRSCCCEPKTQSV